MFYHLNTPTFLYISFWVIMWCPVIFEGKIVAVNVSIYNDIHKFYRLIPMILFRSIFIYQIIDIKWYQNQQWIIAFHMTLSRNSLNNLYSAGNNKQTHIFISYLSYDGCWISGNALVTVKFFVHDPH